MSQDYIFDGNYVPDLELPLIKNNINYNVEYILMVTDENVSYYVKNNEIEIYNKLDNKTFRKSNNKYLKGIISKLSPNVNLYLVYKITGNIGVVDLNEFYKIYINYDTLIPVDNVDYSNNSRINIHISNPFETNILSEFIYNSKQNIIIFKNRPIDTIYMNLLNNISTNNVNIKNDIVNMNNINIFTYTQPHHIDIINTNNKTPSCITLYKTKESKIVKIYNCLKDKKNKYMYIECTIKSNNDDIFYIIKYEFFGKGNYDSIRIPLNFLSNQHIRMINDNVPEFDINFAKYSGAVYYM